MLGLGTQAQLGIGIAIVLQDQFSGTSNKIISSMSAMKKASSSLMDSIARDYQAQQTRTAAVAGAATYGMFQMAKDGATLSRKINQMLVLGGRDLGKSRDDLKKIMGDISFEFGQMPEEMGDAMLENVRAGVRGSLRELTRYQTAAASITGEALGGEQGVGSMILGALSTFNLPITEQNIARVTNAMVAGANISKASIRSIGESLKYAGATWREYGFSVEQASAFAAKLAQSNIEGTSAGVAMNQMMLQLGKSVSLYATKQQKKCLGIVGDRPSYS